MLSLHGAPHALSAANDTVTIFAASSTTEAVSAVAKACREETGFEIRTVFAGSSVLARQISNGAPADMFLSANESWMDKLEIGNQIERDSRKDLLRNELVLVAHVDDAPSIRLDPQKKASATVDPEDVPDPEMLGPDTPLAQALNGTRLAIGDPAHVPAGIYAKQSLSHIGLWKQVEEKLAPASNVRAALALVTRREVRLGVVYATDARISNEIVVVGRFPRNSHKPIVYPIARVSGRDTLEAQYVFSCFLSEVARYIFKKHGFIYIAQVSS